MKKFIPLSLFALAGCSALEGGAVDYGREEAMAGAAVRAEAGEVFAKLNPVCPFTQDAGQLARYEEPAARYEAVKKWVAETPFSVDLAISEGNFKHYWTVNVVDCGATDTEDSLALLDEELGVLNQRLENLEKLAGMI